MAKGTPFSLADLQAKGFTPDESGTYTWNKSPAAEPIKATKAAPTKERPIGLIAIENVIIVTGLKYEREHVFSETRRFRFDLAILDLKCGIEYEGIFSEKSRHTGVHGYTEDANKYNMAQLAGWKVLRYTAKNYKSFIDDIKQLI